jgi:hypothetical protein
MKEPSARILARSRLRFLQPQDPISHLQQSGCRTIPNRPFRHPLPNFPRVSASWPFFCAESAQSSVPAVPCSYPASSGYGAAQFTAGWYQMKDVRSVLSSAEKWRRVWHRMSFTTRAPGGFLGRRFFQGGLGLRLRSFVTTTKPQLFLNHNLKSVPLVLTEDIALPTNFYQSSASQKKNLAEADTVRPSSVRPTATPDAGTAPSKNSRYATVLNRLLAFRLNSNLSIGRT